MGRRHERCRGHTRTWAVQRDDCPADHRYVGSLAFPNFVERLNVELRAALDERVPLVFEQTPKTAVWICEPARVGVEADDLGVVGWMGTTLDGVLHAARERQTAAAVHRLAMGFAFVLTVDDNSR